MYVAITGKGSARVIQFVEQHRIPKTKKKKTVVIETLGNYEKMIAEDPQIIDELKKKAKQLTEEKKARHQPIAIELERQPIRSASDAVPSYHFGHAAILKIWKELELTAFFEKNVAKRNQPALIEAIFSLVIHRIMEPKSIRCSHQDLSRFAGIHQHHKDLYYSALDVLTELKYALIDHLCEQFANKTERTGPVAYYDVTTYAFESVNAGELRLFGYSKDHKSNEVQVVMGLLIDNQGIPISYQIFPGNTMDQSTLTASVQELKKRYKMEKIVVVADRGLNGKDNLAFLVQEKHDFVISYTLKKAPRDIKRLALQGDWETVRASEEGEVTYKEKQIQHELEVKIELSEEEKAALPKKKGRPRKYKPLTIPVTVHVTWSAKRAEKDRKDRERVLEKVMDTLEKPGQVEAQLKRGRNQYILMDKDLESAQLDEARIAYQAQYDGYYAIVTNQPQYTTQEVSGIYGGLWKIEESFRVLKSDLRARPVYVWKDAHIHGHFALCFLSLCLLRYGQYRMKKFHGLQVSGQALSRALRDPIVLAQGHYPLISLTPTTISDTYLKLMDSLDMSGLTTHMRLSEFKKATQLDMSIHY